MRHPDLTLLEKVFEKYGDIRAVYLFGSAAANRTHEESDLDLAILPSDGDIRNQKFDILEDLARAGFCDVDLVFLDNDDIVMQYEAVKHNRIVYQAPDFNRGEAQLYAQQRGKIMKLMVVVHEAEEGGYWAEVPSIPGCATQGETFDELLSNIYEAVEGCLSVDVKEISITEKDKVMEIAV